VMGFFWGRVLKTVCLGLVLNHNTPDLYLSCD
jgi:hypothetical protein